MAYFAITYQLNKDKNYQSLWDEFERLSAQKVMRSFYFVDLTSTSTKAVRDHFLKFIDEDDYLCVVKINEKPFKYKCLEGTQNWIDERF